jgi:hypothetical protein
MPGKVFVSCGQATRTERKAAGEIGDLLKAKGFQPYVAIETQSIEDVNFEIISNLKSSDYYVFVDFRREVIKKKLFGSAVYRGSLFTNQELALTYILSFQKVMFIQQTGIRLEGIAKYIASNARSFSDPSSIALILEEEIGKRRWSPSYSRHLVPSRVELSQSPALFGDHTTGPNGRLSFICLVDIENRRVDRAAMGSIARLASIVYPNRSRVVSPDRTHLKWAGQPGFLRSMLPESTERLDAFSIDANDRLKVFLHSAADIHPREPIIAGSTGMHVLHYEVYSEGFPLLEFDLHLELTGSIGSTKVSFDGNQDVKPRIVLMGPPVPHPTFRSGSL